MDALRPMTHRHRPLCVVLYTNCYIEVLLYIELSSTTAFVAVVVVVDDVVYVVTLTRIIKSVITVTSVVTGNVSRACL